MGFRNKRAEQEVKGSPSTPTLQYSTIPIPPGGFDA
jgi:hypothetical protein